VMGFEVVMWLGGDIGWCEEKCWESKEGPGDEVGPGVDKPVLMEIFATPLIASDKPLPGLFGPDGGLLSADIPKANRSWIFPEPGLDEGEGRGCEPVI
jgi:hypothetical protein